MSILVQCSCAPGGAQVPSGKQRAPALARGDQCRDDQQPDSKDRQGVILNTGAQAPECKQKPEGSVCTILALTCPCPFTACFSCLLVTRHWCTAVGVWDLWGTVSNRDVLPTTVCQFGVFPCPPLVLTVAQWYQETAPSVPGALGTVATQPNVSALPQPVPLNVASGSLG